MLRSYVVILLAFISIIPATSQVQLRGRITDSDTGETLPYASVRVANELLGTITDEEGSFYLQVPKEFLSKSLEVSFLGYETLMVSPTKEPMEIKLKAINFELQEVVIRPLKPEEYIRRALRKMRLNFPDRPFESTSYYRDKILENDSLLGINEGVFKSYHPVFGDSISSINQLILHRTPERLSELQFMKKQRERWEAREQRKEDKRNQGNEEDAEKPTGDEVVSSNFGGPEDILDMHLAQDLPSCIDSLLFKDFRYSFLPSLRLAKDTLMVIQFESDGKFKDPDLDDFRTRQKGKIYISQKNDAIAALDYDMEIVVSAALDALLWAVGFGISDIRVHSQIRYQEVQAKWYPENFLREVDLTLTKRNMFKKNEHSKFHLEQLLHMSTINTSDLIPIPKDQQFDPKKPFKEQVYPIEGITWNSVNTVGQPLE